MGVVDPTVFVVDGEPRDRDAVVAALQHGYRTVSFPSAEEFLTAIGPETQGCVVADQRLPGMTGLALIEQLNRRRVALSVVVLTAQAEVTLAVEAMKAGAVDFLLKPAASKPLLGAINRALIHRHGRWVREAQAVGQKMPLLSERERMVLERLASGRLAKEIAAELGISPRTVEIYRANVMAKLGARNQNEVIRMGVIAEVHGVLRRPLPREG